MEEKSLAMYKHEADLKDYLDKGFVFKKCKGETKEYVSYKYLVVLEKPKTNFKSNENRTKVVNKNFAKFRCNGLITVAIYDLYEKKFIQEIYHQVLKHEVSYSVGKFTAPDQYNEDIDIVCTSGIHYFLTLEAALNYRRGRIIQYFANPWKLITYLENGN